MSNFPERPVFLALALILGLGWPVILWALWLLILLTGVTVIRRSRRILAGLGGQNPA